MRGTELTHIDRSGRARMVDISEKAVTAREAVAEGVIRVSPDTLTLIERGETKKGGVIAVSELAGIMGAKRTADLIPLCHPLSLSGITVDIDLDTEESVMRVSARCRTQGSTGVEMEALTAVSVACLTVYDMLKAADKGMVIEGIRVVKKSGGASGDWSVREENS